MSCCSELFQSPAPAVGAETQIAPPVAISLSINQSIHTMAYINQAILYVAVLHIRMHIQKNNTSTPNQPYQVLAWSYTYCKSLASVCAHCSAQMADRNELRGFKVAFDEQFGRFLEHDRQLPALDFGPETLDEFIALLLAKIYHKSPDSLAKLRRYVSDHGSQLEWGSGCSGCETLKFALDSMQRQLQCKKIKVQFNHTFSAEIEPEKQRWIRRISESSRKKLNQLFSDVWHLSEDLAFNLISEEMEEPCTATHLVYIWGFPALLHQGSIPTKSSEEIA